MTLFTKKYMKNEKRNKVLILGGLGFIGRNLASKLLHDGKEVTLADRSLSSETIEKVKSIKNLTVAKVDILDRTSVEKELKKGYGVVFNLAAHSGPKASQDYPFLDMEINVFGALNVLEAVKKSEGTVLVFMGSRLEYGTVEKIPVPEDAKISPQTFYGVNKFTAGMYHILYHKLFGTPVVVFRGANPYGPHIYNPSPSYNIINYFIDKAMAGETITVYEQSKNSLKDYIYIEDFCEAMIAAISSNKAYGQIFNLGSGKGIRLVDAAKKITDVVGKGEVKVESLSQELTKIESGDFVADISKAKNLLNWSPEVDFEEGIKKTVESFLNKSSLLSKLLQI